MYIILFILCPLIDSQDVEFSCEVHGDPAPTIIWRREEGNIPTGRAQIQDDKSLKIRKVTLSDEGVYVCEAEVSN